MLNRIFVVDSVTLTSTGTAVSSYVPWEQSTRKLPTQVVIKATGQGAYVRLSNDNSAATNADTLVQAGDHVVLSVQGRRWVSVLSDGASSTVNVGALSTGVSGSAASLDLAFVDAGVLDPRVTFTRASTATYFNSAGTLQSAAINAPRFDYNPATLAARGLLIEEQRTNSTIWSESFRTRTLTVTITGGTFTNGETVTATGGGTGTYIAADSTPTSFAIFNGSGTFSGTLTGGTSGATATISASTGAWTVNNATITANSTTAPNGTTTADKLVENTATSTHRLNQTVTGTTNTNPYTVSIFAKADTRTRLYVAQVEGATFSRQGNAIFDLSAGTVVFASTGLNGATGGSATIQNVGSGWYRCTYTLTLGGTDTSILFDFQLVSTGTTNNYTGDGTSGLFLWGAQLEAGAFPTSYIPTTTTALTRSADVASVNTLSPWFNATAGTLYAEFSIPAATASRSQATFGDGTANERMIISNNTSLAGTSWRIVDGGVDQADISNITSFANNATVKVAGAYAVNDFATCQGGGTVGTDTSGTLPTVTTLYLGSNGVAQYASSYLRRITYYPRRLSNAELQAITA